MDHVHAKIALERVQHLLCFVLSQQTVIDEYARQLVADRFMNQCSRDGGIDAAGQAEQNLVVTNFRADAGDGFRRVVVHVPIFATAADLVRESGKDRLPLLGVRDFGMELDAVEVTRFIGHRRNAAGIR